jgi:cell division protease FtsH
VVPQEDGQGYPGVSEFSERTRQRVDDEMRRIVREAHDQAVELLSEHRGRLDALAEALVRDETLEGPGAYAAAGIEPPAGAVEVHEDPVPALAGR